MWLGETWKVIAMGLANVSAHVAIPHVGWRLKMEYTRTMAQ